MSNSRDTNTVQINVNQPIIKRTIFLKQIQYLFFVCNLLLVLQIFFPCEPLVYTSPSLSGRVQDPACETFLSQHKYYNSIDVVLATVCQ